MPAPPATKPPLSIVRAWTFLGINLFATPGLGSVMGGRKTAGRGQLFFSVTGFCLIVSWIIHLSYNIMVGEIDATDTAPVPAWLWQLGAALFGIGWLWSLVTSISLLLEVKQTAGKVPPKLASVNRSIPPRL